MAKILRKHQNTITINGHTHQALEHPRNIYNKDGYITINDSSLCTVNYEPDRRCGLKKKQGLYIQVFADRTVINKVGFHNKSFIGEPYIIYRDNPFISPCFKKVESPVFNGQIEVRSRKKHMAEISFKPAIHGAKTVMDHYIIKLNGEPQRVNPWGKYGFKLYQGLFEKTPKEYKVKLTNLDPNKSYDVEVTAVDGHQNATVKTTRIAKFTPIGDDKNNLSKFDKKYVHAQTSKKVKK